MTDREMDRLISQHVFGRYADHAPEYSRDLDWAWVVAEEVIWAKTVTFRLEHGVNPLGEPSWSARFGSQDEVWDRTSAPRVIVRAALRAYGVEVSDVY